MTISNMRSALALLDSERPLDAGALLQMIEHYQRLQRTSDAFKALARSRLWQIAAGIAVMLGGMAVWSSQLSTPGLLFASGLFFHAFGAAMIATGAIIRTLALQVDPMAPVAQAQQRMARVEHAAAIEGWLLGMSWWFLWVPAIIAIVYLLTGFDLFILVSDGTWLIANFGLGLAAISTLWLIRRWAKRNDKGDVVASIDSMLSGERVREASNALAEIRTFVA